MRKAFLSISVTCLTFLLASMPTLKAGSRNVHQKINNPGSYFSTTISGDIAYKEASASLYQRLGLDKLSLPLKALEYAYKGYKSLQRKGLITGSGILTICDFSQPSSRKRMYIIDVNNNEVLVNTYVAHGKNSGLKYAQKFSNRPGSLQSSLGFYVTKNTYSGEHGLSLKLDGLERGINDKAERRAVVIHGADYIGAHLLGSAYMGRSYGCPAVPQQEASKVIHLMKNKTCLFIYHPNANYLHGSKILNG